MRRLTRVLLWTAGIIAVVLILAVIGLSLFFPAEKIRTMAVEEAEQALGRDVQIGDLELSFWGGLGVRLKDISIGNPDGWTDGSLLSADDIDVKLQLLPLLSGDYRVDRLILNRPLVTLNKTADGTVNYVFDVAEGKMPPGVEQVPAETQAAAMALSFDKLVINEGRLYYFDDSAQTRLSLIDFDLSTSLKNPRNNFYESAGKLTVDSLLIDFGEAWSPYRVTLNYELDYDHSTRTMNLRRTELSVNDLAFEIDGELVLAGEEMVARGSLKSKRIAVADLFRLLPPEQLAMAEDFSIDGDFSLDADVEYNSTQAEPLGYSATAVLSDMKMSRADIDGELEFKRALLDVKPNNLRVNIEDGTFDGRPLKGHLVVNDFEDPRVNGELAGKLNLAFLQPFLPAEPVQKLSGEMEFSTKFDGRLADPEALQFSGNVKIDQARYESEILPEPVEALTLDAYFDNTLTRVNSFVATMPSGRVSFDGRINNLIPYLLADSLEAAAVAPSVDGRFVAEIDLGMLAPFVEAEELSGQLSADLTLAGSATDFSNFKPRGTIRITQATYRDSVLPEAITRLDADLLIAPDTITIKSLSAVLESSDISLTGKLIDPFPYLLPLEIVDREGTDRPYLIFDLTSHRLDLDRLFPEAVPGSAVGGTTSPIDSLPPPLLPDIDGRGTVAIDTLIYAEVAFTDIAGEVYIENSRIDFRNASANVYTGQVTGNTSIDLSDFENPHYTGQFEASQIEANDLTARFSEFGGFLFGKLNLSGSYDATGWEPKPFLNSLSMDGDLLMNEGRLITSGEVYNTINSLASKAKREFSPEQSLKNLASKIRVADGRVSLDELSTSLGDMGDVSVVGSYGFDGTIKYEGVINLSEAWSKDLAGQNGLLGSLGGLFSDKRTGRIELPLTVGGTIDHPRLELDYSALTRKAGENLLDGAGDALKGLFKK